MNPEDPEVLARLENAHVIKIIDFIHNSFATSATDAAKVYEELKQAVEEGKDVKLDWSDISMVSPTFLAGIIGLLHFDFDEDRTQGIFFVNFISTLGEEFFSYMIAMDNCMKLVAHQLRILT